MVRSATKSVTVTKRYSEISLVLGRKSGAPGSVEVRGAVFTDAAPFIIGDVSVELWVDGVYVDTTMSDGYMGTYTFNYMVGAGTYMFQTMWDGNATYFGAESDIEYGIYDKIAAGFTGFSVSPSSGAPPLAVLIDGFLRRVDTSAPLEQKLIHCYRDGVEIDSVKTSSLAGRRGEFWFRDTLTEPGGHNYYVEFEGDDQYAGCEEEEDIALPCTICGHPISLVPLGSEVECEFCHSVFETVIV